MARGAPERRAAGFALAADLDFRCAFGALLAAGLSFSLTIQAFANMAVAVGLGPVTGVPLPLVSMGGTSMLFTSIAFGIILSVSRDVEEKKREKNGLPNNEEKVIVGEIPAMG